MARRHLHAFALAAVLCAGPAAGIGTNGTLLLSRPSGNGPVPTTGDGPASVGPEAISGDGRLIVFTSGADDLGVADSLSHVWLRDTVAGTTTLVDRVPGSGIPANGLASAAAISSDGSRVCFISSARNLGAAFAGFHVYVVTLASGAVTIADRGPTAVGDRPSFRCALDGTGSRVVFDSRADNLVANDSNNSTDVFLRNVGGGTTTRMSVNAMGAQTPNGGNGGTISADGTTVAFHSSDALVPADTNSVRDVYVRNTQTFGIARVSVGPGGLQADGESFGPSLDDVGGRVAFVSAATNLEAVEDTNNSLDIFVHEVGGSNATFAVSRSPGPLGQLGDEDSEAPVISGDGLGVAFETAATNLGAGAPPQNRWVYLRRLDTLETLLLSRADGATGAPANGLASAVSLAGTAMQSAWHSLASNLDPAAAGEFGEVFKRDLSGAVTTTLVSRSSGSGPRTAVVNDSFVGPRAASADGRLVVFQSLADGIDPAAAGRHTHVFVRDIVTDVTTLVSRAPGIAGAVANDDSLLSAISADGTRVAFFSRASNLLDGVTTPQVYVRDLLTSTLELASRGDGPDGPVAFGVPDDQGPDISADGRRVVFVAEGSLVAGDTNDSSDVYVRDLAQGSTILTSVGVDGTVGDNDSVSPSLSDDGMRVAFSSRARNLLGDPPVPGFRFHVYVRDLAAGTTVLADRDAVSGEPGTGPARRPEISGAGNRVAFTSDEQLTLETIPAEGALYVRDLVGERTLLAGRANGISGAAVTLLGGFSVNFDGTRVSFSAAGSSVAAPEVTQVYVRDLAAGTTTVASAADGTTATVADAPSSGNALDAAGGCVAFDSSADNLVASGYATGDFDQVYLRAAAGECPALPTTTTTTLPPAARTPIRAKRMVLRPGRLVKLVARGLSALPASTADPTVGGGTLDVSGTTGSASWLLDASGWRVVGRRKPKGFKFEGSGCRVTLLRRRIKAVCRGDTGGLQLPEPGPLDAVLSVGAEREAFCARCGGKAVGKPARVFKHRRCAAPTACP
jgi:Tol biopolymer transport system component